jgi:fructokinase
MNYVIGLGEALFDCLPTGRKLGGAPANFAYHVSQFGFDSCAISAIGKDELGQEIIDTFDKVGLHYCLPKVDFPTGTVQVTLNDKGIPQYEICLGVAWDNIPLTDELLAIAKEAKAVCFGSLAQRSATSRATINAMLEAMPADTLKVFDINLRQSWYSAEVIENSLKHSNILKINDEELDVVAPMLLNVEVNPEQLIATDKEKTLQVCRQLIEGYALDMVILTCGTNGSYVITKDEYSFVPTPKVEVADTVGAGDSFTGSFIAKLLQGASIKDAHETAVKVSAFVCTQSGAMPVLPQEYTQH